MGPGYPGYPGYSSFSLYPIKMSSSIICCLQHEGKNCPAWGARASSACASSGPPAPRSQHPRRVTHVTLQQPRPPPPPLPPGLPAGMSPPPSSAPPPCSSSRKTSPPLRWSWMRPRWRRWTPCTCATATQTSPIDLMPGAPPRLTGRCLAGGSARRCARPPATCTAAALTQLPDMDSLDACW